MSEEATPEMIERFQELAAAGLGWFLSEKRPGDYYAVVVKPDGMYREFGGNSEETCQTLNALLKKQDGEPNAFVVEVPKKK